jgi:hypothetical protein
MNERIRELALEARLGPALLLHHWGKVDALTDSEQEALAQIEKFAELFVQECVKVAHPKLTDVGEWAAGMRLVQQRLKQHFGVEE